MKIKVVVDREKCIACGTCTAICPEVFELGSDNGKSRVVNEYSVSISDRESIGEVPGDLANCVRTAAESCPVSAINVES